MPRARVVSLILLLPLAASVLAASEAAPDDPEGNARLLDRWRADPEHYARLQRDLRDFWALPRDKRERLRRFDRELHEADSHTQKHLWAVLERYAAWLERLPEAEQQRILSIGDRRERLQAIKNLREQQWIDQLPAKERDYLRRLPDDKRPAEVALLRQADRERRLKVQQALQLRPDLRPRPSKPKTLEDFPPEVAQFVRGTLAPMLNPDESERLKSASGKWPTLAATILELSERHPVLPPPHGTPSYVSYRTLPAEYKKALPQPKLVRRGQWETLTKSEGRWPDFALTFTNFARADNVTLPRPLGACKPDEFAPAVQDFLREKLIPALTPEEKDRLQQAEGRWPAYPRLLHELAKRHRLLIPGMSLPGPRELWESARTAALPEVPDRVLRQFVMAELSPEERVDLRLSPNDPTSRDRLRQEYFRKKPKELQRLRTIDQTFLATPRKK